MKTADYHVATAMVVGAKPKANFSVENEAAISEAPKINFGAPAAPAKPAGQ